MRNRPASMAPATALAPPSAGARALGAAGVLGVLGGLVLLAAFVTEIRPELNWVRLVLFNVGAIAIGAALTRRVVARRAAVVLTASAVIIVNTTQLAMTVLSLGVERPFAGDFGFVFFLIAAAAWLVDAAFGAVLANRRDLTGLVGRLGAVALAVGSLLAIIGMDRIGLVSPDRDSVFKTLAGLGVFLSGLSWIALGVAVALGPPRMWPSHPPTA